MIAQRKHRMVTLRHDYAYYHPRRLCISTLGAVMFLLGAVGSAHGITLVESGHTLKLIADSVNFTDASQLLLGTNNGIAGVAPTGIESITVDELSGKIYVQVMSTMGGCPSTTTMIYEIDPLTGVTTVINAATGFGICDRGSDMDVTNDPASGVRILTVQDINSNRIAIVAIPSGALGTWVTPSVFTFNSFGMQFAPGIGAVPAGDIVYVADLSGNINSAPLGGPNMPQAVPPGGGDDLYIQPDGDIVFVGDFNVGIHVYNPNTFTSTPASLPDVATMFSNAGLNFGCGTRATVCPNTGDGFISYSCSSGGTGVFRVNEPLTAHNLVLRMASDEGIQDISVGPAGDGGILTSLYMTVENYTTGAHQVWEVTNVCKQAADKVSKWTQLPHPTGEGFDAASNLWWNKNPAGATNRVLADDFKSNADPAGGFCNEICQVTWNGSYVDPNFPIGTIDGFIISFFTDQPATAANPSQPDRLVVSYFSGVFEEFTQATCPPGCDTYPVFGYNADLRNACILDNPQGLAAQGQCLPMPATGTIWWVSIEPVLGFTYTLDPLGACVQTKTGKTWPNDFWGWHSTPPSNNFNDDAFLGSLSIGPSPAKLLVYDWLKDLIWADVAPPNCLPTDPSLSLNLSFDLHDIQFNNCWNQPACEIPPIDPASDGVDVPAHYQWVGGDPLPVNVVVADDFISDGRPITCVRWWGSYFDPQYEPQPVLQACCFADGSCQDLSIAGCQSLGGISQGSGTACLGDGNGNGIDDACEQPVLEACCFADGSCQNLTALQCQASGGIAQGTGTACLGDGNGNGIDDACEPPAACGPDPTGLRCLNVVCPIAGQKCLPTCVLVDTQTGTLISVLQCTCMNPNDCHVDIVSSPVPFCTGSCPLPDICVSTRIDNGDGTTTLCCQCVPPQGQCGPDPTGQACQPVTCPIAGNECLPTCAIFDPLTGTTTITNCKCMSPNDCHLVLVAGATPQCTGGGCPTGEVCNQTVTQNADGTITYCCNCSLPAASRATSDYPPEAPVGIEMKGLQNQPPAPGSTVPGEEVRGIHFARTTLSEMQAHEAAHPQVQPMTVPFNQSPRPQSVDLPIGQPRVAPAPQVTPGEIGPPSAQAPALINNFTGTIDDNTRIPPDTMGAAGPNHLVVFLNSGFTIYNKAGALVSAQVTLQSFWSALGTAAGQPASWPFDPKILFDQYADCWIVTSDSNPNCLDGTSNSWVLVGVSATNDPTGAWYLYAIRADVGQDVGLWSDYPGLGMDPNNVIITNNMFLSNCASNPPFRHANVWVIEKAKLKSLMGASSLVVGTDYSVHHDPCSTQGFTFQPCHTFGQTSLNAVNYLVDQGWVDTATRTRRFLRVKSITGIGAAATINCPGGVGGNTNDWVEVAGYNFQVLNAPQPSCADINTNDTRMLDAVLRGGKIYCTHHVGAGTPADTNPPPAATKTEVAWYEIDPTTAPGAFPGGVPDQQGRVANTEVAYYYPSIAVNQFGCIALGFSGSGFLSFASAYYTLHDPATDPVGIMQPVALLKAGQASYFKDFGAGRNRWGDYSATCIDPVDDATFWTIQEYAEVEFAPGNCLKDTGRWGTWWGSFTCSPPTGACCDPLTGNCTDNVTQINCQNSGGIWSVGQSCVGLVCLQTGACCNTAAGTCTDNVTQAACQNSGGTWFSGQTCANIQCQPVGVHQVDGWLISFHHENPNGVSTCPPDFLNGDSPTVLGLYFCPTDAIMITDTGMFDCFQHRVYQYDVDLSKCCLICSQPDPRTPGVLPAQPNAFWEVRDFHYWMDIQAVVGATFTPDASGVCQKVITNSVPSDVTSNGDFWGWHTSPAQTQPQGPLNEACVGQVLTMPSVPPFCPEYGGWLKQPWLCPTPVAPHVDMAFELLTPSCACHGDMDSSGVLNGLDIQSFVDCLIGSPAAGVNCYCADMNGDLNLDMFDVPLFISAIMNKFPCP